MGNNSASLDDRSIRNTKNRRSRIVTFSISTNHQILKIVDADRSASTKHHEPIKKQ